MIVKDDDDYLSDDSSLDDHSEHEAMGLMEEGIDSPPPSFVAPVNPSEKIVPPSPNQSLESASHSVTSGSSNETGSKTASEYMSEDYDEDEDEIDESCRSRRKVATAAGIAGGVVGLMFGGVVGGVVAGGTAAYVAKNRPGIAGDAARAVGDVALVATDKVREVNEKHQIVNKTRRVVDRAWTKAREADQRHLNVVGRSAHVVTGTAQRLANLEREHRPKFRRTVGAVKGFLAKKTNRKQNHYGYHRDYEHEDIDCGCF